MPAMPRRSQAPRGPVLDIGVFGARSIPSTYSGYETFLTTLLPELSERGHRVTMYCRSTDIEGEGPYKGVSRIRLPALPGKHLNTLSHGVIAAIRARAASHDVVLVMNVANSLFCAMNKYTGQRILLNTDGQEWLRGKWGAVGRRFFHLSARIAKLGATGLIADCAAMAHVYRHEFASDSTVIPYCFPPIDYNFNTQALQRLNVRRGEYFIIAGRLNPENNIDRVAESYTRTDLEKPLLVLGTANYKSPVMNTLRQLAVADERIRLVGHVNERKEFLHLVGSATAYIHAHSVGGMNPSLVEAMYSHAFVVALDTAFNRETLGSTGMFFAQSTSGDLELGHALKSVNAMSESERRGFREAAADRAKQRFNVDDVVDAYERLLMISTTCSSRTRLSMETHWTG